MHTLFILYSKHFLHVVYLNTALFFCMLKKCTIQRNPNVFCFFKYLFCFSRLFSEPFNQVITRFDWAIFFINFTCFVLSIYILVNYEVTPSEPYLVLNYFKYVTHNQNAPLTRHTKLNDRLPTQCNGVQKRLFYPNSVLTRHISPSCPIRYHHAYT